MDQWHKLGRTGGCCAALLWLLAAASAWAGNRVPGDLDGDGKAEVIFHERAGRGEIWRWSNTAGEGRNYFGIFAAEYLGFVPPDAFSVAGSGDFDGDGYADLLLLRHPTREVMIWRGAKEWKLGRNDQATVVGTLPAGERWQFSGIGDFLGEGSSQVFWRNAKTGAGWFWRHGRQTESRAAGTLPTAWRWAGVGDFNGDGLDDLLFIHEPEGRVGCWFGSREWRLRGEKDLKLMGVRPGPAWRIVGIGRLASRDRSDIVWRGEGLMTELWRGGLMSERRSYVEHLKVWQLADVADYDGDGRDDLLWWVEKREIVCWSGGMLWDFWGCGPSDANRYRIINSRLPREDAE